MPHSMRLTQQASHNKTHTICLTQRASSKKPHTTCLRQWFSHNMPHHNLPHVIFITLDRFGLFLKVNKMTFQFLVDGFRSETVFKMFSETLLSSLPGFHIPTVIYCILLQDELRVYLMASRSLEKVYENKLLTGNPSQNIPIQSLAMCEENGKVYLLVQTKNERVAHLSLYQVHVNSLEPGINIFG